MKDKTIGQAIEAKKELQKKIESLIYGYEEEYGLEVERIILDRNRLYEYAGARIFGIVSVKLDIRLEN
jgi:hypothetical protein